MALFFPSGQQFLDSNGDPVGAGKLYVYDNETTNSASVYSNPELSSALSNPVVLDSAGRLTTNLYADGSVPYTIKLDTSADAELWSRDDVYGWGDSTLYSGGSGAVQAIGAARFGIGTLFDADGFTALTRTMAGMELTARNMNTTNKYTPAVKFMSADGDFTTENPKLLAAIVGEARETYSADDDGGMALVFFATPNGPGTTNVPVEVLQLRGNLNALFAGAIYPSGSTDVFWSAGSGSPEGVVTANIGSLYSRTDGGAGTSLYVKESGTGNTGWAGV